MPALVVGEAEEARLHAVGEYYHSKGHHRINEGDHAVFRYREHYCVERDEHPVEEASHYRTQSVDGGIFRQTFNSCQEYSFVLVRK